MNAFATLSRDLTCAAAATLITFVAAVTFVQSTAVAPGTHAPSERIAAMQPEHAWFGQPEPAVLVD